MWPEDGRVLGPDPTNEARDISREFCDSLSRDWFQRIKTALEDATYYGMKIYYSPAYDNRAYQESLSEEEYADWVLKYADYDTYGADFISPFSSNDSSLRTAPIPSTSFMSDQETMWELNALQILRTSGGWGALAKKPLIIGPDRGTAEHTVNTIESFGPDHTYIRPDYTSLVDIIGT